MVTNGGAHGLLVIDLERTLDTIKRTKTYTELLEIRHTYRELVEASLITTIMYQNINSMVRYKVDQLNGRC